MITLLNGKIVCGSNYESAAWAVYFMAKGGDGICESIVRKVFSERMASAMLDVDGYEIDRKTIINDMMVTAGQGHLLMRVLMSDDIRNEVEFWLNREDCFHFVEEDRDSVAIIAGYFSMENPVHAIRAIMNMIE